MAEIPFYALAGYLANGSGTSTVRTLVPGVAYPSDWAAYTNDPRYLYESRRVGFSGGDPIHGAGTTPAVWNHDSFAGVRVTVSTVTSGAVTTITLSVPHGVAVGTSREVNIEGVTGADEGAFNGLHRATFTGASTLTIPVNSSALTYNAVAMRVGVSGFAGLTTSVSESIVNVNTDPSFGGANVAQAETDTGAPGSIWGPLTTLGADLHDKNGPLGKKTRVLQVGGTGMLLGRAPVRVLSVTTGTTTEITIDTSATGAYMRRDNIRRQPVTLYGFTGGFAALNGRREVYFESGGSSTVLKVDVDTSGAGSYGGGALIYAAQRWASHLTGEMVDEFRDRVRDCVAAAAPDTLVPTGLSFGVSDIDVWRTSNDQESQQGVYKGLAVSDVSSSGFPVVVDLATPVAITQTSPGVRFGLVGRLTGAGNDLMDLVDVRVISPTRIELLTENSTAFESTDGIKLDVGEPIRFFDAEYVETVQTLQEIMRDETGASELPPVALYHNWVKRQDDEIDTTLGQSRYADAEIWGVGDRAITQALSSTRKIVRVDTSGDEYGLTGGTSNIPNAESIAALGRGIFDAWERAEAGAASGADGALPVYVFLGDSTCEGTINYTAPIADFNRVYAGIPPSERQGEKVWNEGAQQLQDYFPTLAGFGITNEPGNGNTHPVLNMTAGIPTPARGSSVGPELSMYRELKLRHPDTDVVFLKLGVGGSSMRSVPTTFAVGGVEVSNDENGDPRIAKITLSANAAHRRADADRPFQVTITDLPGITQGLVAGTYQATGVGATELEIRTEVDISGTFEGGGSIDIPLHGWLRSENDAWAYLEQAWNNLIAWSDANQKQLDVRGVFVMLGINDAQFGSPSLFEADATQFVADLRSLFTTRSSPTPSLPITWAKPRSNPDYTFSQANVTTVQTALQTIAAGDSAFGLFDPDTSNDDDLEINRFPLSADEIHYTFEGTINVGMELADTFAAIDNTGNATVSPESTGGGGGAVIEELG